MDKKVCILVACHQHSQLPQSDVYLPIQVGAALTDLDLGIQRDNEGENISEKNGSYCELTAMYWAWKNLKKVDVVGICHYRRYLDFQNQCRPYFSHTSYNTNEFNEICFDLAQSDVNQCLAGGVVVPKSISINSTLMQNYCEYHVSDDYRILKSIVEQTQSEKIKKAFNAVFEHSYKMYPYNIFLMRWKEFDSYCLWLFPLLAQVEQATNIEHYNKFQKRIYGFMAERLFNVWLMAEHKQIIEKPIIFINNDDAQNKKFGPRKFIRQWILDVRCNMINCLYNKTSL